MEETQDLATEANGAEDDQPEIKIEIDAPKSPEASEGKPLCCCCLETPSTIQLWRRYRGASEGYGEMISECYDIDMNTGRPDAEVICRRCVGRLKAALHFRRQVQRCQQRLRWRASRHDTSIILKTEEDLDENLDSTSINGDDVVCSIEMDAKPEVLEMKTEIKVRRVNSNSTDKKPKNSPETRKRSKKKQPIQKDSAKENKKLTKNVKERKVESAKKKIKKVDNNIAAAKIQAQKRDVAKFTLTERDFKLEDGVFTCTRCPYTAHKRDYMRKHAKYVHHRMPSVWCAHCGAGFTQRPALYKHVLAHHGRDERYHCNACDRRFNTQNQLKEHSDRFHMLGKPIECPHCDYLAYSKLIYRSHLEKHKTERIHKCKHCHKAFARKNSLIYHERIHTGDKRRVCKVCDERFVQTASLQYHMAKSHPQVHF